MQGEPAVNGVAGVGCGDAGVHCLCVGYNEVVVLEVGKVFYIIEKVPGVLGVCGAEVDDLL